MHGLFAPENSDRFLNSHTEMRDNKSRGRSMNEERAADPVSLAPQELEELRRLIADGKEHAFYDWGKWHRERAFVLRQDRYECQMCKARGRYRAAVLVHHVQHLKARPDLALQMWVVDENGELRRQLVSLCRACHELCHPERQRSRCRAPRFETPERWD